MNLSASSAKPDDPTYFLEGVIHDKSEMADFEGPLSLILLLLSKNKIEIRDIQISLLLDQYLEWMARREELDMEVASEFVTMAAHLVYIKTRMLLSIDDEEAMSEMEQLIASLEEHQRNENYLKIKEITPLLDRRYSYGRDFITKVPETIQPDRTYRYVHDREDLKKAILSVLSRADHQLPPPVAAFQGIVGREPYPVSEKAGEIIDLVDEYGAKCLEKYGTRMFFCADEFYIKAERPLPGEEYYEEYQQLDNGVGMLRSTMNEFLSGLEDAESGDVASFTVATGKAAEPFIARLVAEAKKKFPQLRGEVVGIVNDFFGHSITVSGLVTAQDLITQLKDRPTLGERVLIPANMLRHGEGVFLDDYTVEQVEQALGRRLTISETDGYSLCDAIFRQEP